LSPRRTWSCKSRRVPVACSSARSGSAWWTWVACCRSELVRHPADSCARDNWDPAPALIPTSLATPEKRSEFHFILAPRQTSPKDQRCLRCLAMKDTIEGMIESSRDRGLSFILSQLFSDITIIGSLIAAFRPRRVEYDRAASRKSIRANSKAGSNPVPRNRNDVLSREMSESEKQMPTRVV